MKMPRKTTPVQWMNSDEFKEVRDLFYLDDGHSKRKAIDRVNAWKARSPRLPVAIGCTADLVEILLNKAATEDNFKMACCMAITRLVNLHTEELQQFGRGKPVHELAEKIGLRKWIVDIRHQGTHGHMPEQSTLEAALLFCLDWLKTRFWDPQVAGMEEEVEESFGEFSEKDRAKIGKAITAYMDLMATNMQNNKPNGKLPPDLDEVLKPIKKPLRGLAGKNYLADLLSQDGYLVPFKEREEALGIDLELEEMDGPIPFAVQAFWTPFLDHLRPLSLEPFLVSAIVQQLSKIDGQSDGPSRASSGPGGASDSSKVMLEGPKGALETVCWYLLGWAKELIRRNGASSATGSVNMEPPPTKRYKRMSSWNKTVKTCVEKPTKHSLELLPCVMPLANDPPLSKAKQDKILGAVQLMVNGPNGLASPSTPSNGHPGLPTPTNSPPTPSDGAIKKDGAMVLPTLDGATQKDGAVVPPPSNGLPTLEDMERLIAAGMKRRDRKRLAEMLMMREEEEGEGREKMEQPLGGDGQTVEAWSVCKDDVDWRSVPLGMLPGQPLDHTLFELSGPTERKNKRKH